MIFLAVFLSLRSLAWLHTGHDLFLESAPMPLIPITFLDHCEAAQKPALGTLANTGGPANLLRREPFHMTQQAQGFRALASGGCPQKLNRNILRRQKELQLSLSSSFSSRVLPQTWHGVSTMHALGLVKLVFGGVCHFISSTSVTIRRAMSRL